MRRVSPSRIPYRFLETRRAGIPPFHSSPPSERLSSELLPAHRSEFSLGSWPVKAVPPAPFRCPRSPSTLFIMRLSYLRTGPGFITRVHLSFHWTTPRPLARKCWRARRLRVRTYLESVASLQEEKIAHCSRFHLFFFATFNRVPAAFDTKYDIPVVNVLNGVWMESRPIISGRSSFR